MKTRRFFSTAVIGVVILGLTVSCGLINKMAEPANNFFTLVGNGNLQAAYDSTAGIFKKSTSFQQFEAFMKGNGLIQYKSANWSSVSFENQTGKIKGSVTLKDGTSIPMDLSLVKEGETWKISNILLTGGGVSKTTPEAEPKAEKTIPPLEKLNKLAQGSVVLLGTAINTEDYNSFYNNISKIWQNQITVQKFHDIFNPFKEKGYDLTIANGVTPVFDEAPALDKDGLLHLNGQFPTKPYTILFKLTYHYEYPEWKLFGINVNAK
ncbi:MAG: hypothetical protein DRJ14_05015 [Acidobacteria bacterium]|nr:MAG: hypothetical protein DRJ14_05015 [Acidobacteriota bacterium]